LSRTAKKAKIVGSVIERYRSISVDALLIEEFAATACSLAMTA